MLQVQVSFYFLTRCTHAPSAGDVVLNLLAEAFLFRRNEPVRRNRVRVPVMEIFCDVE